MNTNTKLDAGNKHILTLIQRDAKGDGWCSVSETLFNPISNSIPKELVEFEKLDVGGRCRLTEDGRKIVEAMDWL